VIAEGVAMRKVGLVVGLLLCASYGGRAEAKKRPPPTRSEAFADCQTRVPRFGECYKLHDEHTYSQCTNQIQNCEQLLKTAESAFLAGRWHPNQGPWAKCGEKRAGSPYGRSYTIQCSYLDNIDKDPEFRRREEQNREQVERNKAEKERTLRERCERKWPDYMGPIKQAFDTAPDHTVYDLPKMPVINPRHVQAYFDRELVRATKMLEQPANAEKQLRTYMRLDYLFQLGAGENRPGPCRMYTFDSSGLKPEIWVRREELAAQSTARLEARAVEIQRQQELDKKRADAHDRKVRAATRRAKAGAVPVSAQGSIRNPAHTLGKNRATVQRLCRGESGKWIDGMCMLGNNMAVMFEWKGGRAWEHTILKEDTSFGHGMVRELRKLHGKEDSTVAADGCDEYIWRSIGGRRYWVIICPSRGIATASARLLR